MIKLLKIAIIATLLLNVVFLCTAQSKVNLSVYADAKLLTTGDTRGNEAGTIDVIVKSEWSGNQQATGYLLVFPQYEIANLDGGVYRRYSAGAGYTFNTIVKNIEFTPQINYGILNRFGRAFSSWDLGADISYRLTKNIKLSLLGTFTERKDLQYRWGIKDVYRFNGYAGLKLNL